MSISSEDRQNLISYRLEQAKETIKDVELLIENHRFRSAVNRIYYGMFYSLLAMGLAYEFETSKHSQLIGWFNKKFIYGKLIDAKYGRIINRAYNRRIKSDYDTHIEFDKDVVLELYNDMCDFIEAIQDFLNRQ